MKTASLPLSSICLSEGTQCRVELDQDHIDAIAESWAEGKNPPAVIVFSNGTKHWLADGFHRYHAAEKCCFADIEAEVRSGTLKDAIRFALGANSTHGLPRRNADKRKAIEIALREFPKLNSREIADMCAVHHDTVCQYKKQLSESDNSTPAPTHVTGRDGKSYPATKPAKTPGMKMLESMGATIVDMRGKPVAEVDEETKAAFTAGGREIIEGMAVQKQAEQQHHEPPRDAGGMTEAATLWMLAKGRLDQIRKADPHRVDTLRAIISYCETRITNNK